ncbi:MAG: GIY-YIG nuclease family protein [Proteobacteria bacterium]|nr:GIY-YIG nuclease family protein [Pseudomonadota bacterium]
MYFWVYILASRRNGTLYTGYRDDLAFRIGQHRARTSPGSFTARYGVTQLVWYEPHGTRHAAWTRERQMKEWRRAWKLELIEAFNPGWRDLYDQVVSLSVRGEVDPGFRRGERFGGT